MYKIVNNQIFLMLSHFQLLLATRGHSITSSFLNIMLDCKYVQIFVLLAIGTIYPEC